MHTIDLQTLESALSEIAEVGKIEHVFQINGKTCVMHPFPSNMEREIFEYAQFALEGRDKEDDDDQASSIAYMDRFQVATVSHALVAFENLDLRGIDTVATGGTLPSGQPEYKLRYQAIRGIIEKFTKPLIEQLFLQFGEMMRRVEQKAQKAVIYEAADLGTEIDRLGDQLEWLADQIARQENPDEGAAKKIRDQILSVTRLKRAHKESLVRRGVMDPSELEDEQEEVPAVPEPAPAREAPQAFPDSAQRPVPSPQERVEPQQHQAPPPRHDPPPTSGEFDSAPPPQQHQAPQQRPYAEQQHQAPPPQQHQEHLPQTPQGRPAAPPPPRGQAPQQPTFEEKFREQNPDIGPEEDLLKYTASGDSMMGDDEEASVAAEMARLAAQRQRRVEQELADQRAAEEAVAARRQAAPAEGGAPGQRQVSPAEKLFQERHGGKLPPHAAARQTAEQVGMDTPVPENSPMTAHRPPGQVPSEAYQISEPMPLTKRTKAADDNRSSTVDADVVDGGSNNPRFVGRGQGGGRRR